MPILSPDRYYRSVHDIPLADLRAEGFDTLLVDLDNTLLPRDTNIVPDDLRAWASELAQRGFKVYLVSNNWHERAKRVSEELGFGLVSKAIKPLPPAFLLALKRAGSKRKTSVVVGDQLFTDILGGKLLGMRTVLVEPLSQTDLPHTLVLRYLERVLLAGRKPLP